MVDQFKAIEIDIDEQISQKDQILIDNIFKYFSTNDFTYELYDDKAIIYLNKIDFEELNKVINNTIKKTSSENTIKLLQDIVKKIELIKSYGLKDKKRVYIGYNNERKVLGRTKKEESRGQYYYANNNNFSKINNDLPEKYINKIICNDSETILKKIPDNSIDLIFTSPPYNFGLDYESTDDNHKWEKYFDKLFKIFNECIRVTKYGGRIIINIQPLFSDYIPSHHIISNFFINNKMIWKGEILWEKNNYNCKYTAWGSWKSPGNPYLKYTWEFIEIFCKGTLKKDGNPENADITGDEFKKWVYGKWAIAPERKMKEYGHPAMFPEELVNRVLKLFSFKNDIVLDPFNGVGTTTFVAKLLERRYIGIDISEEYCKKANERLNSIII